MDTAPLIPSSDIKRDPSAPPIGQGGFGVVYRATHFGTPVAMKVLSGVLSPKNMEEFKKESAIHASIRHPHVVLLMGIVTDNGPPAMVMEHLHRSLFSLLESGPLARAHPGRA
jgi:serine/threonine-protein kinase CTR1